MDYVITLIKRADILYSVQLNAQSYDVLILQTQSSPFIIIEVYKIFQR